LKKKKISAAIWAKPTEKREERREKEGRRKVRRILDFKRYI